MLDTRSRSGDWTNGMMDTTTVNVLVTTFSGLSLPPTLCLPLTSNTCTDELLQSLSDRLSHLPHSTRLTLSTTSGRTITSSCSARPLSSYLTRGHCSQETCHILPLHLSVPLLGGKGGFGSQLRAAGGRMSSRKKKQNAALATGSARNLDGRRLRTIAEAKNLAAYLATKPDADAREREEKRRRWEGVVEMAEEREREMRSGKGRDGRRRGLGEEWLEVKEEVGSGVRRAVEVAMGDGEGASGSGSADGGSGGGSEVDSEEEGEDVMELDEQGMEKLRVEAEAGDEDAMWVLKERLKIPEQFLPKQAKKKPVRRRFAGFDDDDDVSSSSDEEYGDGEEVDVPGKGKQKAANNH